MKKFARSIAFTIAASIVPPVSITSVYAVDKPIAASIIGLAQRCAPDVHPLTMAYLVAQESSNDRFAINVNGGGGSYRPKTIEEATEVIQQLELENANYDVGYAQINSSNFGWLDTNGLELFDGCKNLSAAQQVLTECYSRATKPGVDPQTALRDAFSCYNTGNMERGYRNGYVASVQGIANENHVPRLLPNTPMSNDNLHTISAATKPPEQKDAFDLDDGDAFAQDAGGAFSAPQDTTAVMGEGR